MEAIVFAFVADIAVCLTILTYAIMMVVYFRTDTGYLTPRLTLYAGLGSCTTAIVFNMLNPGSESHLRSTWALCLTGLSQFSSGQQNRHTANSNRPRFFQPVLHPESINEDLTPTCDTLYTRPTYSCFLAGAISIGSAFAFAIPLFRDRDLHGRFRSTKNYNFTKAASGTSISTTPVALADFYLAGKLYFALEPKL